MEEADERAGGVAMKVNYFTKRALAVRRQQRDLTRLGYEGVAGPWDLDRGGRTGWRIVDVVIAANGKDLYVKCEDFTEQSNRDFAEALRDRVATSNPGDPT